MSSIKFSMRVPACIKKEGDYFIAACLPLDVFSQGTSEKEALDNLAEALRFFVESCFQRGALEQVLKEAGFELVHEDHQENEANHFVDVPISLLAAQNAQAHAC